MNGRFVADRLARLPDYQPDLLALASECTQPDKSLDVQKMRLQEERLSAAEVEIEKYWENVHQMHLRVERRMG